MRKFKLLKDTPVLKAGAIFEYNHGVYKSKCSEGTYTHYPPNYVEDNPLWFEEIIEIPKMIKGWAHPNPCHTDNFKDTYRERSFCEDKPENPLYKECYLVFTDEIKGWIYTEEDMIKFAEAYRKHKVSSALDGIQTADSFIHLWKLKKRNEER